jgi:predicted TIM-barrel fold metal-dependent hydrolase
MALPERLPPNSCDTHLHVFGDPKIYPAANPHALYHPPQDCTFQALQDIHAGMGIERAVLVQATIYGTDHRLLHDVLKAAPKLSTTRSATPSCSDCTTSACAPRGSISAATSSSRRA